MDGPGLVAQAGESIGGLSPTKRCYPFRTSALRVAGGPLP